MCRLVTALFRTQHHRTLAGPPSEFFQISGVFNSAITENFLMQSHVRGILFRDCLPTDKTIIIPSFSSFLGLVIAFLGLVILNMN